MSAPPAPDRVKAERATFEVVFVCTANRARSPIAEALLVAQGVPSVVARSVGLLELGSVPALEQAVSAAAHFGLDLSAHRTQVLERGTLTDADLVVGFEPAHVSAAIVDGGAGVERTFSLAELSGILSSLASTLSPALGREEVRALAHASRPGGFLSTPVIRDPLGGTDQQVLDAVEEIAGHVHVLARLLLRRASVPSSR